MKRKANNYAFIDRQSGLRSGLSLGRPDLEEVGRSSCLIKRKAPLKDGTLKGGIFPHGYCQDETFK